MNAAPPVKGEEIVLRQEWHDKGPPMYGYDQGVRVMRVVHGRATVVYVRKRGDFDVVTDDGAKYRAGAAGGLNTYGCGDVRVLQWRGAWLHPDQLDAYLKAEARRV